MLVKVVDGSSNGAFWNKLARTGNDSSIFEIHNDPEVQTLADLEPLPVVQRRSQDFQSLLKSLQVSHPSVPLAKFPLSRPALVCAYLCYLAQHPSIRFDAHFIAFLTVKDYAAVEEAIKSDSEDLKVPVASSEDAAVNDKIRLYFVGQVPIDTRYRKVEKLSKDLSRLKKRLKRVEVTIDELVLLQHGCTEHFHRAGQFITAIRGHGTLFSVGVDAPMMEGLEACFVQLQLARLLIDGVKGIVHRMNNFRKTVHLQRLEVAKLAERLEVLSNETTEKPSFDALYAVRQEHDTATERLNGLIRDYECYGDSIISELYRLRKSLQISIQASLYRIFQ